MCRRSRHIYNKVCPDASPNTRPNFAIAKLGRDRTSQTLFVNFLKMASANKKIFYGILSIIIISVFASLFVSYKTEFNRLWTSEVHRIVDFRSPQNFSELNQKNRPISSDVSDKIEAILKAGNNTYTISISEDSSIYDAMTRLSASSSPLLTFKAKEYPGIGYFVEEINGIKNADGKYWTLYVNGKYSTVGASDYKLSSEDRVEWRYE